MDFMNVWSLFFFKQIHFKMFFYISMQNKIMN